MNAVQVTQAGAGEATEMQQEAGEAKVTQRSSGEAAKTQIRARITHVGSEYRKDVTSGTCELCITDWSARIRDISFELTDVDTGATWQTTTPTLHVGRWNDIWEVRVNPFHLSKALAHVTLVVDSVRLNDEGAAFSSPSVSSRPSKPTPAYPRWSSASTAPTSTTTTGTRNNSSSSPGASWVTPTKGRSPFVGAWAGAVKSCGVV